MSPWCSSAALNAAITVGSLTLTPEFIPGMTPYAPLFRSRPPGSSRTGAAGRSRGPRPPAAGTPNRRSRTLLATTNTDDAAIAAPAISGLRNPAAASGIAAML